MKQMQQVLSVLAATIAITATLSAGVSFQQQPSQSATGIKQELPPGPGRDTFVRVCSGCHLTTVATTQRKSADGWTDTVIEMRNRGANASDEDLEQIVQYLATNFGPKAAPSRVNINAAAASEIADALSLPQAESEAIVVYRNKNGKFKDVAALELVPGVESAKIEAAKDRIDF